MRRWGKIKAAICNAGPLRKGVPTMIVICRDCAAALSGSRRIVQRQRQFGSIGHCAAQRQLGNQQLHLLSCACATNSR